ncbi:membrane hypothetical protein [Desulfarculales bacterium]
MVGFTFAIACSANFPALLISIVWKKFTTQSAVWLIITGTILSASVIILSPTVWVEVLGNKTLIIPLRNQTITSMTAAFVVGAIVSLMAPEPKAQEKYVGQTLHEYLGVGSE